MKNRKNATGFSTGLIVGVVAAIASIYAAGVICEVRRTAKSAQVTADCSYEGLRILEDKVRRLSGEVDAYSTRIDTNSANVSNLYSDVYPEEDQK